MDSEFQRDNPQVISISIDDFVNREGISGIDYIKMDIEGCELKALQGAVKTLFAFKPNLAIAIYHRDSDFFEIPLFLNQLDLGYRLYIDHFYIDTCETVLFATARA